MSVLRTQAEVDQLANEFMDGPKLRNFWIWHTRPEALKVNPQIEQDLRELIRIAFGMGYCEGGREMNDKLLEESTRVLAEAKQ